jgi:very-short-patch-repair endonuclease
MTNRRRKQYAKPALIARARELRRDMTPQERKLWARLRSKQLYGIRFRRQHPIDRFVVDLFCHEHSLVIEIDGDTHFGPEQKAADHLRTERLRRLGVRVIRFTNREVDGNLEAVLNEIARQCGVDLGDREAPL